MASSTRGTAAKIWGDQLPEGDPETLAKILYCCDNPPGSKELTGAIDPIGLVYPGLAKFNFAGEHWPDSIEHVQDEQVLKFLEELIYIVPIAPRPANYAPFENSNITRETVSLVADAAEKCWHSILAKDAKGFGESVTTSLEAITIMMPRVINPEIIKSIDQYRDQVLGWKLSGGGGGGYLILISQEPIENGIRIVARRKR